MRLAGYEVRVPVAVLSVLAVVVLGAFVVGGATSGASFGAFNPEWEGTTDLRSIADDAGADTKVATNTTAYDEHGEDTVAVVLAPEDGYTEAEVRRIEAFLDRGGTLLVADRGGTGNELLAALDADARVDGTLLRDERNYYRDPALPVATEVANHSLTTDVDSLTFNYGTAVEPGNSTVLVSSSEFGYLDSNGNGELDDDETLSSYPVATTEPVGAGQVLVVGDASAFINAMAERPENRQFARNVFADGETVLVDTSHSGSVPPLVGALLTVRGSPPLQGGLVLVAVLVVLGWQLRLFDRPEETALDSDPSTDTLVDSVARQYPGFERERLRRLMKGIKSINHERGDDE